MAKLALRIDNGLNEARILLLGGQVLLGFLLRAYFEPRFSQLSHEAQIVLTVATVLLTATLGLLIWPATYHQISHRGELAPALDIFTTRVLDWTLMPAALCIGLSLYPIIELLKLPFPWVYTATTIVLALFLWYGLAFLHYDPRRRKKAQDEAEAETQESQRVEKNEDAAQKQSDLPDRIKDVLIECRMALPGAQALVGFQFVDVFFDSFEKLPRTFQLVHLASLLCSLVATLLLIAPAAYHRIGEGGEETGHFLKVAGRFLLGALVFLAPGMTGDIFVVVARVTQSLTMGIVVASALLVLFYGLWFGYSAWARKRR